MNAFNVIPPDTEVITFDCYGTLIDWVNGILCPEMRHLLRKIGVTYTSDDVLALFAKAEHKAQKRCIPYAEVLEYVMVAIASEYQFTLSQDDKRLFIDTWASRWLPFSDTTQALCELQKRFKLAVISNVDRSLFAVSQKFMGVTFDYIITAEDAGYNYKPKPDMFKLALKVINGNESDTTGILHVAQSRFHDVEPCNALGIPVILIERDLLNNGRGATNPAAGHPLGVLKSLAGFVEMVSLLRIC